jgi:CRISPR-associated endonuclease/helicase Cas3
MSEFEVWFERKTGNSPRPWQAQLAADSSPQSKLIRIPTGFGKTLGVLAAWCFHRVERGDRRWPTRLIWTLPMRVLVEQTLAEARKFLPPEVEVHGLMGGLAASDWHLQPERPAVLVGTQDMLLSRALNRGYAAARGRWPMEHGLVNHDALWVMDEVQLMDVGLATSAQLQTYRAARAGLRPSYSWWMSATLQRGWLESADSRPLVQALDQVEIPAAARVGPLWDDVSKPCRRAVHKPEQWAEQVRTLAAREGAGKLTLVVVNTVDAACKLYGELAAPAGGARRKGGAAAPEGPELRLVHSRFRPHERRAWREDFLRRDAAMPAAGRIIIATQVVEAGVDLDAAMLLTELAPWPNLVQRFGRAARGGGQAPVLVLDREPKDDKAALPYSLAELAAARIALDQLDDVSPASLERFEAALEPEQRAALYPYAVDHLLLEKEWLELFDTTPDLTGADLDVSRFIRAGDERDVLVFWRELPAKASPDAELQAGREELCPVPFLRAQDWLFVKKSNAFNAGKRAWVWDWIHGAWRRCKREDVVPGRTVLVAADSGGYDPLRGFDPTSKAAVAEAPREASTALDHADNAQDREELSAYPWRTIASHGHDVAAEVARIGQALSLEPRWTALVALAAQLHDLGKAHPAFQGSIGHARQSSRPARTDIAKAPEDAWLKPMYRMTGSGERRPGFRHELASALALFAILARAQADHPALLGPWRPLLELVGAGPAGPLAPASLTAIEERLVALDADDFDLVAYLVMSHHGKVRTALHAAPADQDYVPRDGRGLPIRGVREGDVIPALHIDPASDALPAITLTLEPALAGLSPVTGASWADRVQRLVARLGPAPLAFLEAWLRAADVRASRATLPADPLMTEPQP